MHPVPAITIIAVVLLYFALYFLLYLTQNEREPLILETKAPFMDAASGILRYRAGYLAKLR